MTYNRENLDRDERIESLGSGRTQWYETTDEIEWVIPSNTPILLKLFMTFWLIFWFVGLITASTMFSKFFLHVPVAIFMTIWIIAWFTGGYFVARLVWWSWFGKERISFRKGEIRIEREGFWFSKPACYDTNSAIRFRAQEDGMGRSSFFYQRNMFKLDNMGTLRFDYGVKTVKFGMGLEEAEARILLNRLAEKGFLSADKILP